MKNSDVTATCFNSVVIKAVVPQEFKTEKNSGFQDRRIVLFKLFLEKIFVEISHTFVVSVKTRFLFT